MTLKKIRSTKHEIRNIFQLIIQLTKAGIIVNIEFMTWAVPETRIAVIAVEYNILIIFALTCD